MYTLTVARLLGIDVGTSGSKALVIDETGQVLKEAEVAYPLMTPQPGWAEQDPEDWWRAVQQCLGSLDLDVDAIGITGQMHGSVFLDESGNVVRPALLWCDQRTLAETAEIEDRVGHSRIRDITYNPPLTGFQAPKALWLRNNEPENYAKVQKLLLPKDFIAWKLTGSFSTDVSDASGTGFLDVKTRQWSADVVSELGVPSEWLPPVFESDQIVGRTESGIPVVAGAGDQAAGAVGVGAVTSEVVSLSLGTSGVAFKSTDRPKPNQTGAVHVFCHANRSWHNMGVMLSCGGALRWARDVLFPDMDFDMMAELALSVEPGADGLVFQPTLAGERCPVVDPLATAAFAGLRLSHGRAHLARAVFEGVSFGMASCLEAVLQGGVAPGTLRVTGGGAKSTFWVQMIADVTQTPCVVLESDNGPAFGAALLAGVGTGVWQNIEVASQATVRERKRFEPNDKRFANVHAKYKRLYPALKDWAASPFALE